MNNIQSTTASTNGALLGLVFGLVFGSYPCTEFVHNFFDGYQWIGYFDLKGTLGETMHVQVDLALTAPLPSNSSGILQLAADRESTVNQLVKNNHVQYKIVYPLKNPLAEIVEIKLNGKTICAQEEESKKSTVSTRFQLRHIFTPNLKDENHTNNHRNITSYISGFPFPDSPAQIRSDIDENDSDVDLCGRIASRYILKPLTIGGNYTQRGTWPWLAAIYVQKIPSLRFQCGGTLISSRSVVTAAHCLHVYNNFYTIDDIVVFLGRYNITNWSEQGTIAAQLEKLIIHPDYRPNSSSFDADIAIILFKNPIHYSDLIRPACLWQGPSDIESIDGVEGTVVGWGRDDNGNEASPIPKKVLTKIVTEQECLRSNDQFLEITSRRNFCAGNRNGEGPCTGDSGGGFMILSNNRWMLRGTVSFALGDPNRITCNLDEYVVYVDIVKFIDWIRKVSHF